MRLSRRKKKYLNRSCPYYFSISKTDWRNAWDVEMRYLPNNKYLLDDGRPELTRGQIVAKLEAIYAALKEKFQ
jgi:hypothetical protein